MKVIFLDHDGVICLPPQWGGRYKHRHDQPNIDSIFDKFDTKSIKVLNSIISETDCEIVVSSDWRLHCSLDQMKELYKMRGIIKSPIDYTPITPFDMELENMRCNEIMSWLKSNPGVTNWVAVDDMNLSELSNFVRINNVYEGIKKLDIKPKIIKFLK